MAASAVLLNVFYLSGAVVQGFATVAQLQVGRMIGAGDRAALDRAVLGVVAWGFGVSVVVAGLLLALNAPALALLAPDPAVREDAAALFTLSVLTGPAGSLAFILDGVFIGASWSRALRDWMALSVAFFTKMPAQAEDHKDRGAEATESGRPASGSLIDFLGDNEPGLPVLSDQELLQSLLPNEQRALETMMRIEAKILGKVGS
ncbi:MATE family efflux transporter [Paracoccus yeei]|jgi:hypothetical protein|uniref:MATE family efflux transporter n=1 Tax=Paracoccus yeei TaxID=147645 RepID=UPI003BF7A9B4